jgi:hypothetical protein
MIASACIGVALFLLFVVFASEHSPFGQMLSGGSSSLGMISSNEDRGFMKDTKKRQRGPRYKISFFCCECVFYLLQNI